MQGSWLKLSSNNFHLPLDVISAIPEIEQRFNTAELVQGYSKRPKKDMQSQDLKHIDLPSNGVGEGCTGYSQD